MAKKYPVLHEAYKKNPMRTMARINWIHYRKGGLRQSYHKKYLKTTELDRQIYNWTARARTDEQKRLRDAAGPGFSDDDIRHVTPVGARFEGALHTYLQSFCGVQSRAARTRLISAWVASKRRQ